MAQIIFRGVKIENWTGRHNDTGQNFEVSMVADFSDKVREAMGWSIEAELGELFPKLRDKDQNNFDRATMLLPANVKTIGLDGDLVAKTMKLIPNGELAEKRIELVCSKVKNFSLHRTKAKGGGYDWRLDFTVVVVQQGSKRAAKEISEYLEKVGSKPARMEVGYDENAQGKLDGMDGKAEPEVPTDERQEILISPEQAAETGTAADEPGDSPSGGPVLASAREASGRTPGRAGRNKVRTLEPVH